MNEHDNLRWHALNYRAAFPQHAQAMWRELVACVDRAVAAERERCEKQLDALRAHLVEKHEEEIAALTKSLEKLKAMKMPNVQLSAAPPGRDLSDKSEPDGGARGLSGG